MSKLDHLFGVSANNAAQLRLAGVASVGDLAAVQDLQGLSARAGIGLDLLHQWHHQAQLEVHAARLRHRIAFTLSVLMLILLGWVGYRLARPKIPPAEKTYAAASELYRQKRNDEALRVIDEAFAKNENTAALHDLRGMIFRRLRKRDDAITEFQQAVKLDPNYDSAWNNLGRIHQRIGNTELALSEYQKAIALKPDLALYHHNLGHLWEQLGSTDKAEAEYRAAIEGQPSEIDSYKDLSDIYQKEHKTAQAEDILRSATQQNPESDVAFALLGSFYFESGRYADGAEKYARAASLNPGAEYLSTAARTLWQADQWNPALSIYQKLLEKNPKDWEAQFRSGWIYLNKGQDFAEQAIPHLQAAIASTPGEGHNKWCYLNLAIAYSALAKRVEADDALTQALKLDDKFGSALVQRGIFQEQRGDYAAAEKSYQQAIRVDPLEPVSYYNLWMLYGSQYKVQLADQVRRKLQSVDPDGQYTQLMRARELQGKEDFRHAAKIYSKLHDENPADDYILAELGSSEIQGGMQTHDSALIRQGIAILEEGANKRPGPLTCFSVAWAYHVVPEVRDLDKAQYFYEQSLKYDPHYVAALQNLQAIALAKADVKLLEQLSRKLLEQNPKNLDSIESLGYALFLQGKLSDALAVYRRGLEYWEDEPGLLTEYGEALLWSGQNGEAHAVFARARETMAHNSKMSQDTWVWLTAFGDGADEKPRAVYYSSIAQKRAHVEFFDALVYLRENDVARALQKYRDGSRFLGAAVADNKEVVHKAICDLQRLRRQSPLQPAAELGLGYLYDWLGQREMAAPHWKLYLETGTDPAGIQEARRALASTVSGLQPTSTLLPIS